MKRLCALLLCLTVALLCWSPSRHVQRSEQPSSLPELSARDSNPHTTQENGADDKVVEEWESQLSYSVGLETERTALEEQLIKDAEEHKPEKVVNIIEQVVETVHIVPHTQQSEAHPNSDQQDPVETQPPPPSSSSQSPSQSSIPPPSSLPSHQVETELPKASPSPDHAAAADDDSPPPPPLAEPSTDLHVDPNTNADVSADSGNAPEPASPTSHSSLESSSSVLLESVENQDPGTNAEVTASLDTAEPDLTETEHTVNVSQPPEDQEVVAEPEEGTDPSVPGKEDFPTFYEWRKKVMEVEEKKKLPLPSAESSVIGIEDVQQDAEKQGEQEEPMEEVQSTLQRTATDIYAELQHSSEPSYGNGNHVHGSNQKESVFMRLNNRIKALEMNMSLSSRYLEEFSQRYHKQMEEVQRAFNKIIIKLQDTSRITEEQTKAIQMLQSQLENITKLMLNLSVSVSQLQREVLAVGCGNAKLSERLYDFGYRHLTNIDISETVVAHMNQRNVQRHPDLTCHQVDATQRGYESSSFQACLDKGILDAMASEEEGVMAGKMLAEVRRVLAVGGRYVCVTLAQEHVIKLAVEHFVEAGFAIRIHSLSQQNLDSDSSSFALPVFVLICTKFRQPSPFKVLEMWQGEDGTPCRLGSVPELLPAVKERQAYALMLQKLRGATDTASTPSLTLCHAAMGRLRYTLTVQDSPTSAKVPRANHFAIFIVPQGRESNANVHRLIVVAMHRDQEYKDMQAVQSELSPMVMELAPPGMPANHQVPFFTVGGDLGWREVVGRGVSGLTGEYSTEDVRGEDGHVYRRLIFMNNTQLVQSESHLRANATTGPAGSAQKKKNKKKTKPPAASESPASAKKNHTVDRGFLCCTHREVMIAGLAVLGKEAIRNKDGQVSVLVVGLGSGGLPQFIRDFVPGARVDVVELDPALLEVAKTWFGFQTDDRLKVILGDGLEQISMLEGKGGHSYDVIIFDVDSKDRSLGMSCPPPAFVETPLLEKVHKLLIPHEECLC